MIDLDARTERALKQLTGNETLLDMLDTEAAAEMLDWGMNLTKRVVGETGVLDDAAADTALAPRLKSLRQAVRSIGNWAVGKYADPASRLDLRQKLEEYFRSILGEDASLPSAAELDGVLSQVEQGNATPHELILRLRQLFQAGG